MLDNGKAVAMGDGTVFDTTGKVFVDDGIGGFWKSAEPPPPPNPRDEAIIEAIMNARPPLMRIPLRARVTRRPVATRRPVVTRRVVATRADRETTVRRCTSHSKTRRSNSDDDGGGSEPGPHSHSQPHGVEPSGRRAASLRVEVAR